MGSSVGPLRVKLKGREYSYYSHMHSKANPSNDGKVQAGDLVSFLKTSGLDKSKLKNIWEISAKSSGDYLTKEEFYVALKLVALEQKGIPGTEAAIRSELETDLPKFSIVQEGPVAAPQEEKKVEDLNSWMIPPSTMAQYEAAYRRLPGGNENKLQSQVMLQ